MARVLRPRLLGLVLLLLLAACLPIPDRRTELALPPARYRLDPLAVRTQLVTAPGYDLRGTPAWLNRSAYLRYFVTGRADTILILMPGIFGGASSFDVLARQLVASRPGLEVWAIDRRANALEDQRVLRQSLRDHDPQAAYRYYVTDAGTSAGFNALPEAEVSFMRRWGLVPHLFDLHEIVKQADAEAETVVLGGHSLGASLVSLYAAYRFEDGTGDAFIDGLLLLDGTLGRTGAFGITRGLTLGELELIPDGAGFDAGRGYSYLPFGLNPAYYAASSARSLLARLQPYGLAPDTDFPVSNLAEYGRNADDDFAPSAIFAASIGQPLGARYGGNLAAFIVDGPQSSGSRTISGVADGFDAVGWTQDGKASEYTDIFSLLRARVTPSADFNEWYFPLRLLVDMSELPLDLSGREDFSAHSEVDAPTLAIGARRGLVTSLDGFSAYSNLRASALFSSYVISGFTHLDIVTARDNPVVPLFDRWLGQLEALQR